MIDSLFERCCLHDPKLPDGLPTSKLVGYDAGETIFSQGQERTAVRYIREGVVKLTLVSKRPGPLCWDSSGEAISSAFYSTSAVTLVPRVLHGDKPEADADDARRRAHAVLSIH